MKLQRLDKRLCAAVRTRPQCQRNSVPIRLDAGLLGQDLSDAVSCQLYSGTHRGADDIPAFAGIAGVARYRKAVGLPAF